MSRYPILLESSPPWILLHCPSEAERKLIPTAVYGTGSRNLVVRALRGKKMTTERGLMGEMGAALQFFEGFGENWNALEECLMYLDEWLPSDGYVLVISKPELVLSEEPESRPDFLDTLLAVGKWWSRPIIGNGRFDRPARPFHCVLKCDEDTLESVRSIYPEAHLFP